MNPIRLDEPCILFALRRERVPFCREFRPHERFQGAPCWAHFCGPAWLTTLVLETGIGKANVAPVLDWLLGKPTLNQVRYEPRLIIFAGFAGALTSDLNVGDIVLAEEVFDERGKRWSPTWPGEIPEGRWATKLHPGRLLTVDQLASETKGALGERHQATAVDMESALFAERCTRAGVPFACVRAISDTVDTPLSPLLTSVLSGSTTSTWRLMKAVARHPSLVPELMRLARDTRHAAEQLGLALGELLTLTLPWEV